jgi:hypothetical protein
MKPVIKPNITANNNETSNAANWRPPCFTAYVLKAGVLPFRPPANIALKIPPKNAINIPSIGYPNYCTFYPYRS